MDNDFDYITQMVEDTFENHESNENIIAFPIEKSAVNKPESEQLSFDFNSLRGHLDYERSCIVLDLSGQHIEIPTNWGPFKLYNLKEENFTMHIEKYEDVDLFLDVLGSVLNIEIESLQLYVDDKEVLFKINETADVHDLAA